MKYTLINNSDNNLDNFLATVVKNRGIENYDEFMNSNKVDLDGNTYNNLDNIQEGIETIWNHIKNGDMITLVVDPDVDGITSSAIFLNYIESAVSEVLHPQEFANSDFSSKFGFYCSWDIVTHSGKGHGLTNDININPETKLIILPDGGSNDVEEHKKWHDKGVDIVVIDHHQITDKSDYAIVINNQSSEQYTNKDFSGVGVIYRVLQAFDDYLFLSNADNYLDLVALGNISDVMDTLSHETRYFIQQGIQHQHLKNPFLKLLLKYTKVDNANDLDYYIYPTDVAFKIAPPLNAMMRLGTAEEKIEVFTCFVLKMETIEGRAGLARKTYNKCVKYKESQDEERKALMEVIDEGITEDMLKEPVLIVDATDNIKNPEIVGLSAMNISSKYKKPILLGKTKDGYFSGSVRVNGGFPDKEFRQTCENSKLFGFAQGHNGAFGFGITKQNIPALKDYFKNTYGQMDLQDTYEVDFIIDDISNVCASDFYRIQMNKRLWGKGFEEPTFAIENIPFYIENASLLGEKKDTIKYSYRGTEFMFFRRDDSDEMKKLINNFDPNYVYTLTVIGKLGMSNFMGRSRQQVIVDDYEITKNDDFLNEFGF